MRLQQLCTTKDLDAVLLVLGIDTYHDPEMTRLGNWLLYGLPASDINGSPLSDAFSETFIVISRDSFQAYTNSAGYKELAPLCTLIGNCNMHVITKMEENDSERAEVVKVARFYEMIHDKKRVGVPVRTLTNDDYVADEQQLIEKWPII